MTVATALLYDKMEQFKSASPGSPLWTNGDGSDRVMQDGTYLREWHIGMGVPRPVTVIVYIQSGALTRRQTELIRATTLTSPSF